MAHLLSENHTEMATFNLFIMYSSVISKILSKTKF